MTTENDAMRREPKKLERKEAKAFEGALRPTGMALADGVMTAELFTGQRWNI